jgi:16S rRNA processing protein RimM
VITATHGVSGELRVLSFSGLRDHLLTLSEAVLRKGSQEKRLALESVRPQTAGVIVKVAGYGTLEQAQRLLGWELWVPRAQAAPLGDGEFYAADVCRCSLWFGTEEIGAVRSVCEGGGVQLLEVVEKDGRTRLVPFTDHFIGDVEVAKGRIYLKEYEIVR